MKTMKEVKEILSTPLTPETIFYGAPRGSEVSEEVYNNYLNIMPPISLKGGQGACAGFQMGEPYCHRTDKRNGKWRPLFATFTTINGRFFYHGLNFAGEIDSRPYYAKEV